MKNEIQMVHPKYASKELIENLLLAICSDEIDLKVEQRDEFGKLIGFSKSYTKKEQYDKLQTIKKELEEQQKQLSLRQVEMTLYDGDRYEFSKEEYNKCLNKLNELQNNFDTIKKAPIHPEVYLSDDIDDYVKTGGRFELCNLLNEVLKSSNNEDELTKLVTEINIKTELLELVDNSSKEQLIKEINEDLNEYYTILETRYTNIDDIIGSKVFIK